MINLMGQNPFSRLAQPQRERGIVHTMAKNMIDFIHSLLPSLNKLSTLTIVCCLYVTPTSTNASEAARMNDRKKNIIKSNPNNEYAQMLKEVKNYAFEDLRSTLVHDLDAYMCYLMDSGIEEQNFIVLENRTTHKACIITENISALSKLCREERISVADIDPMEVALEACKLTRPFYKTFEVLTSQRQFDALLDKTKQLPQYEPFKSERVSSNCCRVTGLILIGRDLVRRTIIIDNGELKFDDVILAKSVGNIINPHQQ